MKAVIFGKPRTKKTSNRLVKAGPRWRVLPSEAFETWQHSAVPQLRVAWMGREPIDYPVRVSAVFYRDAERGDLIGYMQALADILQTAGVLDDDKWIASWDKTRLDKDATKPRVELSIEALK